MLDARGNHLPPSVTGLVVWSELFRYQKTFTRYIGCVRLACDLAGVSSQATDDPLLERAKAAIKKREPPPKPKMAIRAALVARLMDCSQKEGDVQSAMLYALSYTFMLRVPSEARPLVADVGGKHQV